MDVRPTIRAIKFTPQQRKDLLQVRSRFCNLAFAANGKLCQTLADIEEVVAAHWRRFLHMLPIRCCAVPLVRSAASSPVGSALLAVVCQNAS